MILMNFNGALNQVLWVVFFEKKRYLLILAIVLALSLTFFLFVGGPTPYTLRSLSYAWGLGHFVCFSLWAYLYAYYRRKHRFSRIFIELFILTFLLGGLSEIIQSFIGRQGSWFDLRNNIVGSFIGLFVLSEVRHRLSTRFLRTVQVFLLIVVSWAVFPLGLYVFDDITLWKQFPLLSGFETPLEHTRWGDGLDRQIVNNVVFSGSGALRIEFNTNKYSGTGINSLPSDWSSYRAFSMHIYNPDPDPLMLNFRIYDRKHNNEYDDRFNSIHTLEYGWNHLLVPLAEVAESPAKRKLNLQKVSGFWFYVIELQEPRVIYIDDVRLVR